MDSNSAFTAVTDAYEDARRAFAALEDAHRAGIFRSRDSTAFSGAVESLLRAADEFRAVVAAERSNIATDEPGQEAR